MAKENSMPDYSAMTSEELVAEIKSGNDRAFNILAERFSQTVMALSAKYFSVSLTRDDWFQEGMIGLLSAVRSYNPEKGASFATYASVCITNRLKSVCRRVAGNANAPLDESLEFTDSVVPPAVSVEESYISNEYRRFISENFFSVLSETERNVIGFYIAGFSYREIADRLGMTKKSVDSAICRAKAKLKKAFL